MTKQEFVEYLYESRGNCNELSCDKCYLRQQRITDCVKFFETETNIENMNIDNIAYEWSKRRMVAIKIQDLLEIL